MRSIINGVQEGLRGQKNSPVDCFSAQSGDGVAAMSKFEMLTDEQKHTGKFTRDIPSEAANFKVYFDKKDAFQ